MIFYVLSYAIGGGLAFVTPITHAWLWFPDKPGLASGIVLSGKGIS